MKISSIACGVVLALAFAGLARAADVSGKWTASFETQIGTQSYTYEFKVDGQNLTGTAKSMNGETKITEGKVVGDNITFVENLVFQDMPLRITYTGKISGDEIKFTRDVAGIAMEELVAKRAK
jgi:hypothetical protein